MHEAEPAPRNAVAQHVIGTHHITITSRRDESQRIYTIGLSDAYETLLAPLAADAAATWVGTRALIAFVDAGRARPCSPLPKREDGTTR